MSSRKPTSVSRGHYWKHGAAQVPFVFDYLRQISRADDDDDDDDNGDDH